MKDDAENKTAETAAETKPPEKTAEQQTAENNAARVEKMKTKKKKKQIETLDTSKKSVEQLTELYNSMVQTAIDLGLKKIDVREDVFQTPEIGRKACERLHTLIQKTNQQKETTVKKATKKTSKKSAKKPAKKAGGKRVKFEPTMKITWKGKDNPFREGTGRFKRTEIVRAGNGKTVQNFLDKRGKLGTLGYCVKNGLASVA